MVIARVLYEIKSSGASWRAKLAKHLMSLEYKSSGVDSDAWMKRDFKPKGGPYYKYMLCYFDDLLHIIFNPKEDMNALNNIYRLKEGFANSVHTYGHTKPTTAM